MRQISNYQNSTKSIIHKVFSIVQWTYIFLIKWTFNRWIVFCFMMVLFLSIDHWYRILHVIMVDVISWILDSCCQQNVKIKIVSFQKITYKGVRNIWCFQKDTFIEHLKCKNSYSKNNNFKTLYNMGIKRYSYFTSNPSIHIVYQVLFKWLTKLSVGVRETMTICCIHCLGYKAWVVL